MDDAVVAGFGVVGTNNAPLSGLSHEIVHQPVVYRCLGGTKFLATAILFWGKGIMLLAVCHSSFPE